MKDSGKIGLIDWGIGGLGVYKEIKKQIKSVSIVYFSDAGYMPYGKTPKKILIQRLHRITKFFRYQNIKKIVIACNAASTVLDQLQKRNPDIHYFGMLQAGENLISKSKKKSVLILGGKRTIDCGFFQKAFKNSNISAQALVAQPLSGLIEKGLHGSKKFETEVDRLVLKTKDSPTAVLLACTHYPAAKSVFKKKFKKALILDPAFIVAADLKKKVLPSRAKSTSTFYTTGSTVQSQKAARKAFNLKISSFQKVKFN